MALNLASFKTAFKSDVIEAPASSAVESAANWAQTYIDYAKNGQTAFAIINSVLASAQSILEGLLTTTFETSLDLSTFTSQVNAAFSAFWLTPGNIIFVPPSSIVTGVGTINFINLIRTDSIDIAVSQITSLFDVYTRTVIVTGVGPVVGNLF